MSCVATTDCAPKCCGRSTEACTEVTVWGESALFASDRRFRRVRHDLSAAARAFTARALLACGRPGSAPACEEFVSAALWYPTDGADLVTVGT